MDTKHIEMILKPYDKCGFRRTDYYSAYDMQGAVIVTDNNVDALADVDAESVVAIDVCDFSCIGKMKYVSKLCIVFTKKLRRIDNIEALYSMDLQTFLFSDPSHNIDKIDIARFRHLTHLKTRIDAVDLSCACANLAAIELNDILGIIDLKFINNFPKLKKLSLDGGILELNGINSENKLESLIVEKSKIIDYMGLANLSGLKKLALKGVFDADIITVFPHLKSLEYLCLDSYIEIDNVDWVKDMPNLKIIILGCVIRNRDTSPLVKIRHARLKEDCANYNFRDVDLHKDSAFVKLFE